MSIDFKQVLADSGIPTDEAAATALFRGLAFATSSPFNNQSPYSPFWRLVSACAVKPVMYLSGLLSDVILPALFLKTASGEWVDLFAWQLGLERKQATKAIGRITLTRYSKESTLTVPAGTVIQSASIGGEVFRLYTISSLTFEPGVTDLNVLAEAEETGTRYNLASGFYALIATDLAGIAGVSNGDDWLVVPGTDVEDDDALKDRCRLQVAAVNSWHIDQAYTGMVTQWAGVDVADVFIDSDAPRGPGTANIYILFDQSEPAQTWLDEMNAYVNTEGNHGFSDDVLIDAIPYFDIEQTATVELANTLSNEEASALLTNIESFIRVAFRQLPNTNFKPTRTEPHTKFRWSKLIFELHSEFAGLLSLDFANDTDLEAQLAQPNLSALTVIRA